jgi:hypothetical protein
MFALMRIPDVLNQMRNTPLHRQMLIGALRNFGV